MLKTQLSSCSVTSHRRHTHPTLCTWPESHTFPDFDASDVLSLSLLRWHQCQSQDFHKCYQSRQFGMTVCSCSLRTHRAWKLSWIAVMNDTLLLFVSSPRPICKLGFHLTSSICSVVSPALLSIFNLLWKLQRVQTAESRPSVDDPCFIQQKIWTVCGPTSVLWLF
jgi:hypothetical protein